MVPQIIYIVLMAMGLGISLIKHGEPRGDYSIYSALIGTCLAVSLLWWGGFFSVFGG